MPVLQLQLSFERNVLLYMEMFGCAEFVHIYFIFVCAHVSCFLISHIKRTKCFVFPSLHLLCVMRTTLRMSKMAIIFVLTTAKAILAAGSETLVTLIFL